MSQGLQLWDASGNLILDTSMRLGRVLNVVDLSGATDGSEENAGLLTGTPFWMVTFLGSFATYMPTISVVGDDISWAFGGKGSGNSYKLVYGVF